MSEMQELSLAHAFVTHKFPVTLPSHYNPAGMPTPKGDMVVVAVKAQKQTRDKATVWVEFLLPPSHAGKQIQQYPKSLEPKNGPAQGADFSLLTAVKAQFPHDTTWCDLGVATPSNSHTTVSASLTHARRMDGFCNQNADQLGSLAGLSLLTVYVGVVECAPASPYTYSSSTHRFPDERTPIEATPLSATSAELGLGLGLGHKLGLDSLAHSSSHALPFFSPPTFHTLAFSPAFTSVWWSA